MKPIRGIFLPGLLGLLVLTPALSTEAAPLRSITVFTVGIPEEVAGNTEIDLDMAFLARISPRFTLVGKAGIRRLAPDSAAYRAGVGAAWDFGGGFYIDGYATMGVVPALSILEYEAMAALNYETDTVYSAIRSILRSRLESLSSLSSLTARWTWPEGISAQGVYSFAWEQDAGTGHALWVETWVRILPFLEPRLGATISRETNGDLVASLRMGLTALPWPDVRILCVVEPFFLDRAGAFTLTAAVDVSIR